jgi:hypothetical protein
MMILPALALLGSLASALNDADIYSREVKPVLARRCVSCHGVLKQKAGLRLDSAAAIVNGGETGPAVEPGAAGESLLVERVTAADESSRMPPEGEPLKPAEIAAIRAWIESGAKAPAGETAPRDPRDHWAFRPPVRSSIPDSTAGANPIDAFLGALHRRIGLTPRPRAEKAELFRRVALDLTGLAPSRDAMRAFLADPAPDAYEKAVDRLLASPQFGERWGRHWMDVWRYSDWDGFAAEIRESRPFIWHWRDWIVESLNGDLGYDRIIVLMLAADEADPANDSSLRATGFLARNWDKFSRVRWLDNNVEHTAKAFLGLTIACARCHDHKYDPIAQTDYYRFRAFFEPHDVREDRLPLGADAARDGLPRAFDAKLDAPTYLFIRGDDGHPDKSTVIAPGVPAFLTTTPIRPTPIPIPAQSQHPLLRDFVKDDLRAQAARAVDAARRSLSISTAADRPIAEVALLVAEGSHRALSARIVADEARLADPTGPETKLLARQAKRSEAELAAREAELRLAKAQSSLSAARKAQKPGDDDATRTAFSAALAELAAAGAAVSSTFAATRTTATDYNPLGPSYPAKSTGRRLALANWIASPENPLTARVAVNHVWARHFGRPLVGNTFDFGLNGQPPTHPALLDWLATEFVAHSWSLKHLHRLIVTSDAYTRKSTSSGPDDPNVASDPDNLHYWRMNPRRMEAEAVRDNLLSASGMLDPTLGGPDLDPGLALVSHRRSLYLRHAQEKRAVFLKVFDSPSANDCYRRVESVMPQQALALANSPLAIHSARRLASELSKRSVSDPQFIAQAFEAVLGRDPSDVERAVCERFLNDQARRFAERLTLFDTGPDPAIAAAADPGRRAREGLVHVLFNHNDFVTIR